MKGIELSRAFFNNYGVPMLAEFPALGGRFAAGIAGKGSECFGFDDAVSPDHDFSAGFCIWLTDADDERYGYALSRAYARLPKEYMGVSMQRRSAMQASKFGIHTVSSFYESTIGIPDVPACWQEWFFMPSHALAEATNGAVFLDGVGEFTRIRSALVLPDDVRLKKLSAHLCLAAQSGQYNYSRCIKHGEAGAARLALAEFVMHYSEALFLLDGKHAPFYKWRLRSLRGFEPEICAGLEALLEAGGASKADELCLIMAERLRAAGLSSAPGEYLEPHAFEILKHIRNREISSLHITEFGA